MPKSNNIYEQLSPVTFNDEGRITGGYLSIITGVVGPDRPPVGGNEITNAAAACNNKGDCTSSNNTRCANETNCTESTDAKFCDNQYAGCKKLM